MERLRTRPFCEDCGRKLTEETADLHHVIERTKGRGFRLKDGNPGVDHPDGLRLLCRRCHNEYKP